MVSDVTDFFESRLEAGGASRGAIRCTKASIAFFEMVYGEAPRAARYGPDFAWQSVRRRPRSSEPWGATETCAASSSCHSCFPWSCMSSKKESRPALRVHAWWKALQCWCALRHDDHHGLAPDAFETTDVGVTAQLSKTKTTGADKAVRTRPLFLSAQAYCVRKDWFAVGLRVLGEYFTDKRAYLLPTPAELGWSARAVPAQSP